MPCVLTKVHASTSRPSGRKPKDRVDRGEPGADMRGGRTGLRSKILLCCSDVFSPHGEKLSYFVGMLVRLKLRRIYDGFLYLAEAARNPPLLKSHHHVELELNLLVRGSITYVV